MYCASSRLFPWYGEVLEVGYQLGGTLILLFGWIGECGRPHMSGLSLHPASIFHSVSHRFWASSKALRSSFITAS